MVKKLISTILILTFALQSTNAYALRAPAASETIGQELKGAMHEGATPAGDIDTRPVANGLLAECYVGYDHVVKKVVNPDNKSLVGIYAAAGIDVANFLLSTNCASGYFIDIEIAELDTLQEALRKWGSTPASEDYKKKKYSQGYGVFGDTYAKVEPRDFRANTLIEELRALGVKKEDVRIDQDEYGRPRVRFTWAYMGDVPKERTITFIKTRIDRPERYPQDLRKVLEAGVDIYYQHAGMVIPIRYEKFMGGIASAIKEGGFLVMDNYIIPDKHVSPIPYINKKDSGFAFTGNKLLLNGEAQRWEEKISQFQQDFYQGTYLYGWRVSVMEKISGAMHESVSLEAKDDRVSKNIQEILKAYFNASQMYKGVRKVVVSRPNGGKDIQFEFRLADGEVKSFSLEVTKKSDPKEYLPLIDESFKQASSTRSSGRDFLTRCAVGVGIVITLMSFIYLGHQLSRVSVELSGKQEIVGIYGAHDTPADAWQMIELLKEEMKHRKIIFVMESGGVDFDEIFRVNVVKQQGLTPEIFMADKETSQQLKLLKAAFVALNNDDAQAMRRAFFERNVKGSNFVPFIEEIMKLLVSNSDKVAALYSEGDEYAPQEFDMYFQYNLAMWKANLKRDALLVSMLKSNVEPQEYLKRAKEILLQFIKSQIERDKIFAAYVRQLSEKYPDTSVVFVRGLVHQRFGIIGKEFGRKIEEKFPDKMSIRPLDEAYILVAKGTPVDDPRIEELLYREIIFDYLLQSFMRFNNKDPRYQSVRQAVYNIVDAATKQDAIELFKVLPGFGEKAVMQGIPVDQSVMEWLLKRRPAAGKNVAQISGAMHEGAEKKPASLKPNLSLVATYTVLLAMLGVASYVAFFKKPNEASAKEKVVLKEKAAQESVKVEAKARTAATNLFNNAGLIKDLKLLDDLEIDELKDIFAQIMRSKDKTKVHYGDTDYLARVSKDGSKIELNTKHMQELPDLEVEALMLHESIHMLKRRVESIQLARKIRNGLPGNIKVLLSNTKESLKSREDLKKCIALLIENEREAYAAEFAYRKALGINDLEAYFKKIQGQTKDPAAKFNYGHLIPLARNYDSMPTMMRLVLFKDMEIVPEDLKYMIEQVFKLESGGKPFDEGEYYNWALGWLEKYGANLGSRKTEIDTMQEQEAARKQLLGLLQENNYFTNEIQQIKWPESAGISKQDALDGIGRLTSLLEKGRIKILSEVDGAFMALNENGSEFSVTKKLLDSNLKYAETIMFHEAIHLNPAQEKLQQRQLQLSKRLNEIVKAYSTKEAAAKAREKLGRNADQESIIVYNLLEEMKKSTELREIAREMIRCWWVTEIQSEYGKFLLLNRRAQVKGLSLEDYIKSLMAPYAQAKEKDLESYIKDLKATGYFEDVTESILFGLLMDSRTFSPEGITPVFESENIRDLLFRGEVNNLRLLAALARLEFDTEFFNKESTWRLENDAKYLFRFLKWARQEVLHKKVDEKQGQKPELKISGAMHEAAVNSPRALAGAFIRPEKIRALYIEDQSIAFVYSSKLLDSPGVADLIPSLVEGMIKEPDSAVILVVNKGQKAAIEQMVSKLVPSELQPNVIVAEEGEELQRVLSILSNLTKVYYKTQGEKDLKGADINIPITQDMLNQLQKIKLNKEQFQELKKEIVNLLQA